MIKGIHNKTQEFIFDIVANLSFALMIISSLGVSAYAPAYSQELKNLISLYVSLVLLWRFNPLRPKVEFSSLDRKIAFSAGAFIMTTTFLNKYIELAKEYVINMLKQQPANI
jgi:hypothetical protein